MSITSPDTFPFSPKRADRSALRHCRPPSTAAAQGRRPQQARSAPPPLPFEGHPLSCCRLQCRGGGQAHTSRFLFGRPSSSTQSSRLKTTGTRALPQGLSCEGTKGRENRHAWCVCPTLSLTGASTPRTVSTCQNLLGGMWFGKGFVCIFWALVSHSPETVFLANSQSSYSASNTVPGLFVPEEPGDFSSFASIWSLSVQRDKS